VVDWVAFLTTDMLFGPDDPLFPATFVKLGNDHLFEAAGLSRLHWSSATPIRIIFKEAFQQAGLPYFNPHAFRRTLAQLGERLCRTPEEIKAWSQNLGHENVLTTFLSYGEVARARQAKLIRQLGHVKSPTPYPKDALDQLLRYLQTQDNGCHTGSRD
jgi:integrase